ncbi:MAG: hypothetical protein F6K62_16860 [Sphaerospermopsis sp. SIO1G2]|nr:hypothetical protein [Sphaerospermopsis sp. SIO1G2]
MDKPQKTLENLALEAQRYPARSKERLYKGFGQIIDKSRLKWGLCFMLFLSIVISSIEITSPHMMLFELSSSAQSTSTGSGAELPACRWFARAPRVGGARRGVWWSAKESWVGGVRGPRVPSSP